MTQPTRNGAPGQRDGQSLIEACLVIALVSLCLFGAIQLSLILAAREIMEHAAARGARARTVGFNKDMVQRVVEVAAIPTAGRMRVPEFENINEALRAVVAGGSPGEIWSYALRTTPVSEQAAIENARIPSYLGAESPAAARYILDYDDWTEGANGVQHWVRDTGGSEEDTAGSALTQVHTQKKYRLWLPMHRAFYADDRAKITGDAYLESHFNLYLRDMGW